MIQILQNLFSEPLFFCVRRFWCQCKSRNLSEGFKKGSFFDNKTTLIGLNYPTRMESLFKRRFTKGLVVKQITAFKFTLVF